jgi:hypothetical protein
MAAAVKGCSSSRDVGMGRGVMTLRWSWLEREMTQDSAAHDQRASGRDHLDDPRKNS